MHNTYSVLLHCKRYEYERCLIRLFVVPGKMVKSTCMAFSMVTVAVKWQHLQLKECRKRYFLVNCMIE